MNHRSTLDNFRLSGEFFQLKFCLLALFVLLLLLFFFFLALFVEYFWVRKFLFLSKGAIIIHSRGSGDDIADDVWDIPKFGDILVSFAKVPSSGFLGLVSSGLLKSRGGFLLFFEGFVAFSA